MVLTFTLITAFFHTIENSWTNKQHITDFILGSTEENWCQLIQNSCLENYAKCVYDMISYKIILETFSEKQRIYC